MNYSTNFGLKLPQRGVEMANINDLNDNTEDIDTIMHQNRTMLGEAYDPDKVGGYEVGDFVVQLGQYYECISDTSGVWDPTAWQLTDIGTILKALADGGGGGGGHTYSTQEQVVGTWIDGRPVYSKTFELGTLSSNNNNVNHNISNLAQVIDVEGYSTNWDGSTSFILLQYITSDLFSYIENINGTRFLLYCSNDVMTYYKYNVTITLRYIKTVNAL